MDTPLLLAAFTATTPSRRVAGLSLTAGVGAVGAFTAMLALFGWQSPATAMASLRSSDAVLAARLDSLEESHRTAMLKIGTLDDKVDLIVFSTCLAPARAAEIIRECAQRGYFKPTTR